MTTRVTGVELLLAEDDAETRRWVASDLAAQGYRVTAAATGREALRAFDAHRPDAVLLDLGLPDMDGLEVVSRLRRAATTPILILSARDQERDKVEALERGADDYVTKPFGIGELHARIRALLRRVAGPAADASGKVTLGSLVIDGARHEVRVDDRLVALTPREFELLRVLITHSGRVVTRGRLLRSVWGDAYSGEAHYLHVYVSRIRQKLAAADPSGKLEGLIVAEPAVGYRIGSPEVS